MRTIRFICGTEQPKGPTTRRRALMDKPSTELLIGLENDIRTLRQQIKYWEDPRVIALEDISGSKKTAKEVAAALEARINEIRQLIQSISK
jgi:hypothetical protein